MSLLIYAITVFGFEYIVGRSVISQFPREIYADVFQKSNIALFLLALIECPACLGFWIGLIVALKWPLYAASLIASDSVLLFAIFTSGTSLILGKLTRVMD